MKSFPSVSARLLGCGHRILRVPFAAECALASPMPVDHTYAKRLPRTHYRAIFVRVRVREIITAIFNSMRDAEWKGAGKKGKRNVLRTRVNLYGMGKISSPDELSSSVARSNQPANAHWFKFNFKLSHRHCCSLYHCLSLSLSHYDSTPGLP